MRCTTDKRHQFRFEAPTSSGTVILAHAYRIFFEVKGFWAHTAACDEKFEMVFYYKSKHNSQKLLKWWDETEG